MKGLEGPTIKGPNPLRGSWATEVLRGREGTMSTSKISEERTVRI